MKYKNDITTFKLLPLIAAAMLFVGCQKELPTPTPDSFQIILAPSVQNSQPQTKYQGGADFESGDEISAYSVAWTSDTPPLLSIVPAQNNFHNAKFTRDNTYFNFEATASVSSVGFPPNGSSIDIYAIYPYDATPIASVTEHKMTVPTDQSTEAKMLEGDYLVAKKSQVAPQLQPINLVFSHIMAKFSVDVIVEQDYKDKGVKVSSVKFMADPEGKVNLTTQTGTLNTSATAADITTYTVGKTNDADGCVAQAILPAQRFAKDVNCVAITMSNAKTHYFAFSDNYDMVFNTVTKLTLKVSYGSSVAVVVGTVQITDWGTGSAITPSNPIWQNSQNKFITTPSGDADIVAKVSYAAVTATVGGENRTYELPVTKNADGNLAFEFRGVGNRPNTYPFTITKVKYYDSAWVLLASSATLNTSVTSVGEQINLSQTF